MGWMGGLLRGGVEAAIFCYSAGTVLLFVALELIGERWWPLAVLLYVPQSLFLLPMVVLVPAGLLAEAPRRAWWALGVVGIIFLWHVPYHMGWDGGKGTAEMKLITNNYAQNHGLSLQPMIDAEDPDFVTLQDAATAGPGLQRMYPGRSVRWVGQFALMSKYPVVSATALNWPGWAHRAVAAVFVVEWKGREVAIYSVHLPTPRGDFAKLAGLGLVREAVGMNRRGSDGMSFGEAMAGRVELARALNEALGREPRPFVVAGDFNMTPWGYERRVMTRGLTDCFAARGRGFGFTFPGDANNPLTLGEPWLRLDYVMAGPGWRTEECRVVEGRRTKHRPVVARLSLGE